MVVGNRSVFRTDSPPPLDFSAIGLTFGAIRFTLHQMDWLEVK
jgi:hypothetical protein